MAVRALKCFKESDVASAIKSEDVGMGNGGVVLEWERCRVQGEGVQMVRDGIELVSHGGVR